MTPEPDARMRTRVYRRDSMACVCCGTPVTGRPHSALRRNVHAGDRPANLLTFLGDGKRLNDPADHCARVKSGRDPSDRAKGYSLGRGQDPLLVPVMVFTPRGPMLALLSDGGKYLTNLPETEKAGAA